MSKIKIGDRVRIVREYPKDSPIPPRTIYNGTTATLERFRNHSLFPYGVRLKNGAYITVNEIEPLRQTQPVIVITSDGKMTTATKRVGKQVICTASTRCNPCDTFDFNTGATIALERLRMTEKPVPKYYNGRIVCINTHKQACWTVGKIYPVVDGRIKFDDGSVCQRRPFVSLEDVNEWFHADFLEITED